MMQHPVTKKVPPSNPVTKQFLVANHPIDLASDIWMPPFRTAPKLLKEWHTDQFPNDSHSLDADLSCRHHFKLNVWYYEHPYHFI